MLVGMGCSAFAVLISIFNMVMCSQNEFDPILLESDLMARRERHRRTLQILKDEKREIKRTTTLRKREDKKRRKSMFDSHHHGAMT